MAPASRRRRRPGRSRGQPQQRWYSHPPQTAALAAIKAELIGTAEAFLGLMAADVVARINGARDATQLLRVLGQWHMAMQASKNGREAAETVLQKSRLILATENGA